MHAIALIHAHRHAGMQAHMFTHAHTWPTAMVHTRHRRASIISGPGSLCATASGSKDLLLESSEAGRL